MGRTLRVVVAVLAVIALSVPLAGCTTAAPRGMGPGVHVFAADW